MKHITPSPNKEQWPRQAVKSIDCRKRDLIIRIADWTMQKDEPAYDVEVYIGGVYDWNESQTFTLREYASKDDAKAAAISFAQKQTEKLL